MKRKASNQLAKMIEKKRKIASVVTPIVSDGDLQLDFIQDLAQPLGLLVSHKLLCIASPVFKAMLGDDSRFSESTTKTLNANGVQVVRLGHDNYTMMEIIMNVIHLQGRKVPPTLLFPQLIPVPAFTTSMTWQKALGTGQAFGRDPIYQTLSYQTIGDGYLSPRSLI